MCGGGGGQSATIYKPDYDAYNREFELQRDAINQQMSNSAVSMQTELQGVLRDQNSLRADIAERKIEIADDENSLQEEAMRLSTLLGAPPPEKSAQAPAIGSRDRNIKTKKGKGSLRIGRTASSSSQGTGLNIT